MKPSPSNHSQGSILITGGTGFAGSHLIEHLITQVDPRQIHVTSYQAEDQLVAGLIGADHIHQLDLTDYQATKKIIDQLKPRQVYHLAAIATAGNSFDRASAIIKNNLTLQLNLLNAIKEITPQCRVLSVGSAQEYDVIGHPSTDTITEDHPLGPANPYGVSKVAQDLLGLSYHYAYQLDVVTARPFNHIGERQTPGFVVPDLANQIVNLEKTGGGQLKVGNLAATRDFSDVKDVVVGYQIIMDRGQIGQSYNVGSGRGYKIQQILDTLIELSPAKIEVVVDQTRFRPIDVDRIIANNSKLVKLGWQPTTSIEPTLKRIMDSIRQ